MHQIPFLILATVAAAATFVPNHALAQGTTRVSVDSTGQLSDAPSSASDVTPDGRFVAFSSVATNLVPGDTNGVQDIFVHDRLKGTTRRVSVDSLGVEADNFSDNPSISADGRYVAFESKASNLVAADTNLSYDVFVHDCDTGVTTRVSVSNTGEEGDQYSRSPSISADGRRVAFVSQANNFDANAGYDTADIYVRDVALGMTELASISLAVEPNGPSSSPALSGDGKVVAFASSASNLVAGDTNGAVDVFVRKLGRFPHTRLISVTANGQQPAGASGGPSISFDGELVAFHSVATNVVANDTNGAADVFVRDRTAGITQIVSVDELGNYGDAYSHFAEISADGSSVVYASIASNLVANDTNGVEDIFVYHRPTGEVQRVSVNSAGVEGNWESVHPAISDNGRFVSYTSRSRSDHEHIFFHDREAPSLIKLGSCPGPMTLVVFGGTIGDEVAIAYGQAGHYVKPSPPCQGIELGIEVPVFARLIPTFSSGQASVNFNAPMGACGLTFQAVDVASCKVSNPIVL